ncbi:MAG: hypothetical protein KAU23_08470 [Anaerolineales bacterium]|nr:hypothetical protein [Anaerolineales bacterium]
MLIRLTPLLGLGVAAVILGYRLADWIPGIGSFYQLVIFLGLLLGMIILGTEPGWNVTLYLGFALAAGVLLFWSGALVNQLKTWILFSVLFLISLAGGAFSSRITGRAAALLFPITIFYLMGWILFLFFPLPGLYKTIWIIFGLVLFTLITIAVFNRGKILRQEESAVPLNIELFVVLFNLYWLSGLIWL